MSSEAHYFVNRFSRCAPKLTVWTRSMLLGESSKEPVAIGCSVLAQLSTQQTEFFHFYGEVEEPLFNMHHKISPNPIHS